MCRNIKNRNKEAVSAVIGVILMVAITVAIAATVYVYVSGAYEYTKECIDITGNVTKIVTIYNSGHVDYTITFDYNDTYKIIDDFDWELGRFYNMSLCQYNDDWQISRYIEIQLIPE